MIGKGEEIPVSSGRIKFDFFLLATYCTAPEFSLTTMINYYLWYNAKKTHTWSSLPRTMDPVLHTLLNAKSSTLDANIAEGLHQWPENMPPLGVQPTIQELADDIRSLANGKKAVRPGGFSAELSKITSNGDPTLRRRLLDIPGSGLYLEGGGVPQQ